MKVRILPKQTPALLLIGVVLTFLAAMLNTYHVPLAAAAPNSLTGDYVGSVTVSTPPSLGNIDLAFHLELYPTGNMILSKSFILLEKTALFPKVAPQVKGRDLGPRVLKGYLDPAGKGFYLQTQPFVSNAGGKEVTRQITLKKAVVNDGGSSISGTYVETISGYMPKPFSVIGRFVLARPVPVVQDANCCQDLDKNGGLSLQEIRVGGRELEWTEFADVSCAMRYHVGLAMGPTVDATTMAAAIQDYRDFLAEGF